MKKHLLFALLLSSAAQAHDDPFATTHPDCICPVVGECFCPSPTPEWKKCHDEYWFLRDGITNPQNVADLRDALIECDAQVNEVNAALGCPAYPVPGVDHDYAVGIHALGLEYRFPQHPIESNPLDVPFCEAHKAAAIATVSSYLILNDICATKLFLRRLQLSVYIADLKRRGRRAKPIPCN